MTLEQEKHLQELLKQWRDERHLTVESQRDGLMGNLCEEMAEYYRATNKSEKIDALCDIYVFCMNSLGGDLKFTRNNFEEINKQLPSMNYAALSCRFFLLESIESKLKELKVGKALFIDGLNHYLYVFMRNVEKEATEMSYDFYQCMLETIEEISSRTGHYDENIHKFVKDRSPEAVTKWYKADYSKCKITER